MKKVLIILVILVAPFAVAAQDTTASVTVENTTTVAPSTQEEVKTDASTKETADAKFKAEANDMNYKKSNDIISIKAYRKSLQIKIREVIIC